MKNIALILLIISPIFVSAQRSAESKKARISIGKSEKPNKVQLGVDISDISSETTDRRVALVIGNSNYEFGGTLPNTLNDARDISQVLSSLGFDVMTVEDANTSQLKRAIRDFGNKLNESDVGLFYYAGHGIQSQGFNYFIPVDANLSSEDDVDFDCVRTDRVLKVMETASNKTNIMILDACRNNPFERSWNRSGQGKGLAFMDAPSGSFIAYATSPGRTASDGTGRNGLYTAAILRHIQEPNLTIEQVFKKVRESVEQSSGDKQTPWESTSLTGEFYFYIKN